MSKTKNVVIDDQNAAIEREQSQTGLSYAECEQGRPTGNKKQEIIKHLTDVMGVICNAHWKGREIGVRVHESRDAIISIDLYHFEGDGLPVCDGLNPCTITCDDGSTMTGNVFCMCYNPDDEVTPLVFLFTPDDNIPDIEIDPDDMLEESLKNVVAWLEQKMIPEQKPDTVMNAKDIIALWSDWCMDWDDENLWLDYMVKHPNGHCNRRHLQEKWDYCYNKYGSKAAMNMFWRELDNDNRAILVEYITTQWHKND